MAGLTAQGGSEPWEPLTPLLDHEGDRKHAVGILQSITPLPRAFNGIFPSPSCNWSSSLSFSVGCQMKRITEQGLYENVVFEGDRSND